MIKHSDIDTYIKSFPSDVQNKLTEIRKLVKKLSPTTTETISYGIPTFKLNGKNLVHFAGYKKHIGFYPTPSTLTNFQSELSNYKTSKGAVQFKLDEVLPVNLIEKIIKFRIEESSKSK